MRWIVPLLALTLCGCVAQRAGGGGKPTVVATTNIVADLVRQLGGDDVEVKALMGPGVDPHLYKASPGDVRQLQAADAVVYTGLHLEGKMADVLGSLGNRKPVHAVAEALPKDRLLSGVGAAHDPHVWFDVVLWAEGVQPLAEFLAKVVPARADEFRRRAADIVTRYHELDAEVRASLAAIPKARRVLITAHDAFRYFGRAYDVEVLGVQGISTESEAGLREIERLVVVIADRKIGAVFVETSVSPKNVQALVEGARAKGAHVRIGGQLYSDALGDEGTPEGTYEGMVRKNVSVIVDGLK